MSLKRKISKNLMVTNNFTMVEKNIETDDEDESSLVEEAKKDAKTQKKADLKKVAEDDEDFDDEDELKDDDLDEIEEE